MYTVCLFLIDVNEVRLARQSSVLYKCKNNNNFHLNFLNHIIASGFCSKAFSFFESLDASVTPCGMNWKSEMRFA